MQPVPPIPTSLSLTRSCTRPPVKQQSDAGHSHSVMDIITIQSSVTVVQAGAILSSSSSSSSATVAVTVKTPAHEFYRNAIMVAVKRDVYNGDNGVNNL